MTTIRTLIAVALAVLLFLFWRANGGFVRLDLGPAGDYDVAIPLLVLVSFLIGLLPMWLLGLAQRAIWRRRLAHTERRLEEVETELERAKVELLRPPAAAVPVAAAPVAAAPVAAAPVPEPDTMAVPVADPAADPAAGPAADSAPDPDL